MLNIIIFSKDRACQLDLLLRSIKLLWKEWSDHIINILWTASTSEFKKGYLKLISEHTNINFKQENNFRNDLINIFDLEKPYSVFFVDDQVFKEPFSLNCSEFKEFKENDDIITLSLRLYPGIKYCYPAKMDSPPPQFIKNYKWHWFGLKGDWGYPASVDGHIIRTKDIAPTIYNAQYTHPNNFEDRLVKTMPFRPLMACFEKSIVVNNPINKVGHYPANKCGTITAESLNEKYLNGERINLDPILGMNPISCHQEFEYQWSDSNTPEIKTEIPEISEPITRKYHLGCGTKYLQGYCNIDFPQPEHTIISVKADLYSDLVSLKYKPCIEIRSHHVFEHFNYIESLALLVKWTQALMLGGILRIDIPDIKTLCQGFINSPNVEKQFKFIRMIFGSHEAKWAYHINGWTETSLTYVLDRFGFKVINSNSYGNVEADFPNCGIDMIFKKIDTHNLYNLQKLSYNILKLYVHENNEQNLYEYYCKKLDELLC